MINEDKKETCHPAFIAGSHKKEMLKLVRDDMKGKFLVPFKIGLQKKRKLNLPFFCYK